MRTFSQILTEAVQIDEISSDMATRYAARKFGGEIREPKRTHNPAYHERLRNEFGPDDDEVKGMDREESRYQRRMKIHNHLLTKTNNDKATQQFHADMAHNQKVTAHYGQKFVSSTSDHPGRPVSGIVVGADPSKKDHVIVRKPSTSWRDKEGQGVSVHKDHLR